HLDRGNPPNFAENFPRSLPFYINVFSYETSIYYLYYLYAERVERLRTVVRQDAFVFHIKVKRLYRQLAADSRFLVSAKRRSRECGEWAVHHDDTRLQLMRHARRSALVCRPNRSSKPVLRIVRTLNDIFFVRELLNNDDRSENFFANCFHLRCDIDNDGRRIPMSIFKSFDFYLFAACKHRSALFHRGLHVTVDDFQLFAANDRSNMRRFFKRIAQVQLL